MEQENEPVTQPECPSKISLPLRGAIPFLALMILMLAALFLTAGTFRWLEDWILLGLAIVNMVLLANLLPPGQAPDFSGSVVRNLYPGLSYVLR